MIWFSEDVGPIQFSNIEWHIPEHDCEENKAFFVTRDDMRLLCKICLCDLNQSSTPKVKTK